MCSNFEKDKQQPQLWLLLTCGPNLNFELSLILGCLLLHAELKVQTTGPNENMAIVGIEEDGNELVLPSEIIRKTGSSEVRVASYFFRNMTGVLPDTSPDLNESRLVSPVISSLLGCGVSICGRITTTDPIRVVLRHEDYQVTLQEPNCVFWEFVK